MSNNLGLPLSRRAVTAAGTGLAASVLAMSGRNALTQDASPQAEASPVGDIAPLGFVMMRMRPYETAEIRDDVNQAVIAEFLPVISSIEGFEGYLVGDVLQDPRLTYGLTVLSDREAAARSNEVVKDFVFQDQIDEHVVIEETRQWIGDLLMLATSGDAAALTAGNGAGLHIAVRIHTSLPGTDPRDFVAEATSGFLPIVTALPGFIGYLWFPVEGGFVAVSIYDSEASAQESTAAAADWAAEHLADYTDLNPEVIDVTVVYADMPILER